MTRQTRSSEQVSGDRIHTAVPSKGLKRANRVGLDEDLAWFLECSGSAMGERGTLGGIVSALERGGVSGGFPDTCPYTDQQLGTGRVVFGEVERHRWLLTAWNALTPETQGVLLARYMPPPSQFRSDEGYGAREKYLKDAEPEGPRPAHVAFGKPKPTPRLGKRGQPVQVPKYERAVHCWEKALARHNARLESALQRWEEARARRSRQAKRTGVESVLGEMACLAFLLCSSPEKLFLACRDPNNGNRPIRDAALAGARAASDAAHAEWKESKNGADPMRTRSERVAVSR